MIVVTGAAGFIGSCLVSKLNNEGYKDLILVDDFSNKEKNFNILGKKYIMKFEIAPFLSLIKPKDKNGVDFVFHIGACADTMEFNKELFDEYNLNYSKSIWKYCTENNIPLIYASSAASYGSGEFGYDDEDMSLLYKFKPLNPYAESKNDFDKWVIEQTQTPPFWYGLKFFNVFGPNEYHKGTMASMIFHSYNQISKNGNVKLFKSYLPEYKNGEQLRDFIYVKDIINVILFLMNKKDKFGIYNLGTGKARSFLDIANSVFKTLNKIPNIEFIDIPLSIRDKYQYFTEAKMDKLRSISYDKNFYTLEDSIDEYINRYLIKNSFY